MSISNQTAIIAGASGTLGPGLIRTFQECGFNTVAGSRRDGDIQYSPSQLVDTEFWYQKIAEFGENSSVIQLVNLIGQPRGREGYSLHDINVRPPMAMAKAAKEYALENPDKKVVMVQVSAIAAKYLTDNPYGFSRAEADGAVMETALDGPLANNYKAVVIQFPFIFSEPNEEGHIKGLHPWSMEQIAALPIIPVVYGGRQALYPVSHSDALRAIVNAHTVEESQIIEARGSNCVSNIEMIQVYSRLAGRNPLFVTLPAGLMAPLLDHMPYGLLDGYGPRLMAKLPSVEEVIEEGEDQQLEPFQQLLGKKPDGIIEKHEGLEQGDVTLESPPIVNHIRTHSGKLGAIALGVGVVGLAVIGGIAYFAFSKD